VTKEILVLVAPVLAPAEVCGKTAVLGLVAEIVMMMVVVIEVVAVPQKPRKIWTLQEPVAQQKLWLVAGEPQEQQGQQA